MTLQKLQKLGGVCATLEALIYIFAFITYGAVLVYPEANASAIERLDFLSDNYLVLSILNLVSYVLFGIVLAILVLAIHQRLKNDAPILSKLAFIFGVIWVGLVIASGMISSVGLNHVMDMGQSQPERTMLFWSSISTISEALGGGNEIVGGIWVLILSIASIRAQLFSKPLIFLGILVGLAGILTVYPLELFTEIFGISQIVWFLWVGIFMIRQPVYSIKN